MTTLRIEGIRETLKENVGKAIREVSSSAAIDWVGADDGYATLRLTVDEGHVEPAVFAVLQVVRRDEPVSERLWIRSEVPG